MKRSIGDRTRFLLSGLACVTLMLCGIASVLAAAPASSEEDAEVQAQVQALKKAHSAVLGIRVRAVEGARSEASLGRDREGSGVVIDADGLVLTIGYLILEADQVQLLLGRERVVPARTVAYDVATGFGLVQALTPLKIEPAKLGEAGSLSSNQPLIIASGGDRGGLSVARLVSRRPFSGYWEYHIEGALFTTPPRLDHSGAALFDGHGSLLGIGSLITMETLGPGRPRMPGNMFVPIDLLKPILGELRRSGHSQMSERAWIGVNCIEQEGEVRVVRVNSDSPAEVAGVEPGDRIVRIDGDEISALEPFYKKLWSGGAPEREVRLQIKRGDETQTLVVQSVDRMKTLRRAPGI